MLHFIGKFLRRLGRTREMRTEPLMDRLVHGNYRLDLKGPSLRERNRPCLESTGNGNSDRCRRRDLEAPGAHPLTLFLGSEEDAHASPAPRQETTYYMSDVRNFVQFYASEEDSQDRKTQSHDCSSCPEDSPRTVDAHVA